MDDRPSGKALLRLGAWLLAAPYLLTLALLMSGSPTWSGVAYLLAMGLLLGGLMTLPKTKGAVRQVFGKQWPRGISRAGLVAVFAIMFVRCCSAGSGESLHMATSARIVDRLIDERDIALSGTRVLSGSRLLQDDRAELPGAMREAYERMAEEQGDLPSPVLATYLGLQRPDAYDMVVIEPPRDERVNAGPTAAVIFLHGYAGNFSLPCWQVSQAVKGLDVVTACPSTSYIGDWSSPNGEATLRDAVKELRARGIERIVLAGLSNGGYGASLVAPKMKGAFVGVVFISGTHENAPSTGVPTLLIHGRHDGMAGYEESVAYHSRHASSQLVTLNAGHFAMLVRSKEANAALRSFVMRTTGARDAPTGQLKADRSP